MQRFFSESAVSALRDTIAEAGGNEVFFVGRTNSDRIVVQVEPLARGSRDAVAAILIATSFGDVVIHNHPSGHLTPSRADLEIASILGNQGVGFYLVDNDVERCYAAVSPFAHRLTERLSLAEIERFFAAGGVLAGQLPGYEFREEQLSMATTVSNAFNHDQLALVEAGTGTGKSLAYLLPAILWATRNEERVVISTNTINLQEQLTRQDIPFFRTRAGLDFRAVLVKGRSNYLCLRKLELVKGEPSLFRDEPGGGDLEAILSWSVATADGCRSDLTLLPPDELWEELCCEADQCGRVACPWYGRCFFYRARREAASADLLVVNHSLLITDLALRQEAGYSTTAILPPFQRLIFDEGHHLEDVATSHFSAQVSSLGLLKTLAKLQQPTKAQRGLFARLSTRLSSELPESLDDIYIELSGILESQLVPKRQAVAELSTRTMDAIGLGLQSHLRQGGEELKLRVTPPLRAELFWRETEVRLRDLVQELVEFTTTIRGFLLGCERLPTRIQERLSGDTLDLRGILGRIEATVRHLEFFVADDEGFCRWFEARRGRNGVLVRLCSSPLEVAGTIKSAIWDTFKTVIVTSATLTVAGTFEHLKQRTGLVGVPGSRLTELALPSPFDYTHQALVLVPSDMPEPTGRGFEQALGRFLLQTLSLSHGRAFVLFTSHDLLNRVHRVVQGPLAEAGLTLLRQGDMSRHQLLARFRSAGNGVLLGTDSFWEGVDVKGKALELVIITRLPFRVPTEPIIEARVERISATGGDPFMEYTVPQAVIKFKQGFGRLIRSRDDRGAVLILDSRVASKNYGRFFLRSLPPARLVKGPGDQVLQALADFFGPVEPHR